MRIPIKDDSHWHSLRKKHIGGTETASLFGLSPYSSLFELYHRKLGNIPEPDFSDNSRVFWGKFLEPSIAAGVASIKNWKVTKSVDYMTNDNCPGHGASLDYEILDHPDGPGILEIKTADYLTFKNDWEDEKPPINYELQLQTQMACSGFKWGCVAVLVGGNDLKIFDYVERPKTIQKIESGVTEFWKMVRNQTPPSPMFEIDHEIISQLYGKSGGGFVNLTGVDAAENACVRYHSAAQMTAGTEKLRKAARAEILTLIGNADKAICGDFKISSSEISEAEISYKKQGYRNIRVTKKTKK